MAVRAGRRAALPLTVAGVGLAVIVALQGIPNRHSIEGDLTGRSATALRAAGLSTVDVSFVGRDGTVRAHSPADADRALAIVRAQDGGRVVTAQVIIDTPAPVETPSPPPAPSPTPSPTPAPPAQVQGQLAALPTVTFEVGSATLTPDGQTVVARVATILRDNPGVRISIEGHTDSTGTAQANLELSHARAQTVLATLVSLGIQAQRLTATGFGATRPQVPDTGAANQAINRRVAFVVQP